MEKSCAERYANGEAIGTLIGQCIKTALHSAIFAWVCLKVFIAMGYVVAAVETPDDAPAQMHVVGQGYGRS